MTDSSWRFNKFIYLNLKVLREKYKLHGKMAEFIDFLSDVDTTDSEMRKG